MRSSAVARIILAASLLLGSAAAAAAQGVSDTASQRPIPAPPASPAAPAPLPPEASAPPESVRSELERLRARGDLGAITSIDSVLLGDSRIGTRDSIRGSVVVHGGSLELNGFVDGSVAVVGGDLVIGDGATVTGSAAAVGGLVRVSGGEVGGEIRSSSAAAAPGPGAVDALDPASAEIISTAANAGARTWRAVKLVTACFGLFLVLAVGILVFSQPTLDAVVGAMEERFARTFWYGVLAQFALLPVLLLLVVALAISVIGILLIPFALVAYVIAVAGVIALGFLAAARLTGGVFGTRGGSTARGAELRGIVAGLLVYFGVWMIAAGLSWHPLAATLSRAVALAVTWVAVTLGLGGIIAAGLAARRARAEAHLPRVHADAMAWQTPTPITGVVAARRPLSSVTEA